MYLITGRADKWCGAWVLRGSLQYEWAYVMLHGRHKEVTAKPGGWAVKTWLSVQLMWNTPFDTVNEFPHPLCDRLCDPFSQ